MEGRKAIDIPAGNGVTTEILLQLGAQVKSFDLFPEYFRLPKHPCERANIAEGIPVPDAYADLLVCQEGIEHFKDQLQVLKECNRVLKDQGRLILTTPSYSDLASKFSYLVFERETTNRMPPNEIDDVWKADAALSQEIYHGHIFLIGLQKLRILSRLAGFRLVENRFVRVSKESLFLFPFLYPIILIYSLLAYSKHMRKDKGLSKEQKRAVYREQLMLNMHPKNLVNRPTFWVPEKEKPYAEVSFDNEAMQQGFHEAI